MKGHTLVLLVLLCSPLALAAKVPQARAGTITVPDDYSTIQEAINAANNGDTVFVRNGIYYENVVLNKTLSLIGEGRESTVIDANQTGTVVDIAANDILLTGLTLRNSGGEPHCGVQVSNVLGLYVSDCSVNNNSDGFDFSNARNCVLRNNSISNNSATGIQLGGPSRNNTFHQNDIAYNKWGTQADYSDQNTYSENRIFLNQQTGIFLSACRENNLVRNHVHRNHDIGISLWDSSRNTISENNISDCSTGIWLVNTSLGYFCSDNVIYHNNFINKTASAFLALQNIWDNGCEGNYWNNYGGSDLDGDGIGDTPHIVSENNTDHYPLMNAYWHPADINKDLEINIYDAVLMGASYYATPSDPHWNCHCDIVEPFGIIDLFDVVLMADSYGEEYHGP